MIYGSVCSGIEAATVAWHPLGWTPAFFSEIEPFPSRVLAHHYPQVPNRGDMTKFAEWPDAAIDVLVGGTPCQSFSVAGLRKGMADPRGNLALVYLAMADRYRPRWLVWENVPGVLSSNGGRDFGAFLGGLVELGYGFAYRVLDAQYFGLAQRRKRVFVVGHLGDWRRAAAVLLERESLRGDPAPRREARERIAPGLAARAGTGGGLSTNAEQNGGLIAFDGQNLADCGDLSATLDSGAAHSNRGMHIAAPPVALCLNAGGMGRQDAESETLIPNGGCFGRWTSPRRQRSGGCEVGVRRLTPMECERLQGFPDRYTAIPGAKDGPRYKALGNSFAVPVVRWIGERIQAVESLDIRSEAAA